MRVLFAGTPEIALPSLHALSASSHELVGVLTAPDRPSGRGRRLAPSPVKALAIELGVPVLEPDSLRGDARRAAAALGAELLACFAYGKIFGPRFLELFPRGKLNVHPSLLPRHRGPAPIPGAILAGDSETGVTIQDVALEMDAGDIYAQERIPLEGTETTAALSETAALAGAKLLVDVVDAIEAGTATTSPQDESLATYTKLVEKGDGEIDWSRPAAEIERMVRAYTPWPRAFTSFAGERLVIHEAALPEANWQGAATPGRVVRVDTASGILVETGNGLLALRKLQLQSRKPLEWRTFINGVTDFVGTVLGGS
ncbi:MAG: methionyl-tRNA formyltransferase [Spirochaetota bacterium]